MDDRVVVEFALVTYRRENIAFENRGFVENHQRLVGIARENHVVEGLLHALLVLDHDAGRATVHLPHRAAKIYLVPKVCRQVFVDAPRSPVPCLHGCSGFDIEKFEIPGKERCRHIEHICRHQKIDEHRLQDLIPEVPGKSAQIQNRPHADVIERVEGIQKLGLGTAQPTKPMQTPQDPLELRNLGL